MFNLFIEWLSKVGNKVTEKWGFCDIPMPNGSVL